MIQPFTPHSNAPPIFGFLVHPLITWQRRLLGVRRGHGSMLLGGLAGIEGVGIIGRIRILLDRGPVEGVIVSVPGLPEELISDQHRAIACIERAAAVAIHAGAQSIGLANALGVIGGRGKDLTSLCSVPISSGLLSTAWTCAETTWRWHQQLGGSIGVFGFRGPVGDAVAGSLAARGATVLVEADGPADQRRAISLGVQPATRDELLALPLLVGASTNGPLFPAHQLRPGTTLIDLALPPTLSGRPRAGVRIIPGERLYPPQIQGIDVWGNIWLSLANYGRSAVFACLAEPVLGLFEPLPVAGRRLHLSDLDIVGARLTTAGFRLPELPST